MKIETSHNSWPKHPQILKAMMGGCAMERNKTYTAVDQTEKKLNKKNVGKLLSLSCRLAALPVYIVHAPI